MVVSVETPVFKGARLKRCIDSVLHQSSPDWRFSLVWDGGDEEARRILEDLDRRQHPNVTVHFTENRGIARARRFLTDHSRGDYILPLDDDDALPHDAVERFLEAAGQKPWASVIRARRDIIDEDGKVLDTPPWFPFEPRHYQHGMVTDLMNHTQPYLISRRAYDRTSGWEGFEDFGFAGEDCDIYLKLEEVGTVELLDEHLYYYRVHPRRQSLVLTDEAAFEMWRRLADKTIARIGLPLRRVTELPPFVYERLVGPELSTGVVDFVILTSRRRDASERAARIVRTLTTSGVARDAVRVSSGSRLAEANEIVELGHRPFVCLIDADVELDLTRSVEMLLQLMRERSADLVAPSSFSPGDANLDVPDENEPRRFDSRQRDPQPSPIPRLALARREVLRALGGFDEGFENAGVALLDFCFRAGERRFGCVCPTGAGFAATVPGPDDCDPVAVDRLRRKWAGALAPSGARASPGRSVAGE